ncbi:MAG: DUF3473 domain-containing protein [Deltaproteobacteria bacterium]|nr:DUF3473 domain-containing protein [Deltaproteobacteria bacterium]
MVNAMTVDVEEYFTIQALDQLVPRGRWSYYPSRVDHQTRDLLDLFEQHNVRATFFVLGWVAERHPALIREIAARGHEIAAHSYWHRLVFELSRDEFKEDLRRVRGVLEDLGQTRVIGYRAPTYSVTKASLWAHEILVEEGFEYSSSIFPIVHDRYGIPDYSRHPTRVSTPSGPIWEFPLTTLPMIGARFPVAGGGYMRLLPARLIGWALRRVNQVEGQPGIIYLHPWEIDPDIPRFRQGFLKDTRSYVGLRSLRSKLDELLGTLPFSTVQEVLGLSASN